MWVDLKNFPLIPRVVFLWRISLLENFRQIGFSEFSTTSKFEVLCVFYGSRRENVWWSPQMILVWNGCVLLQKKWIKSQFMSRTKFHRVLYSKRFNIFLRLYQETNEEMCQIRRQLGLWSSMWMFLFVTRLKTSHSANLVWSHSSSKEVN